MSCEAHRQKCVRKESTSYVSIFRFSYRISIPHKNLRISFSKPQSIDYADGLVATYPRRLYCRRTRFSARNQFEWFSCFSFGIAFRVAHALNLIRNMSHLILYQILAGGVAMLGANGRMVSRKLECALNKSNKSNWKVELHVFPI